MPFRFFYFLIFISFFTSMQIMAQNNLLWKLQDQKFNKSKAIDSTLNTLKNNHCLLPFLEKLCKTKSENLVQKTIIVHIGDSHIQADMMTCESRNEFQSFFGNAGRGLVFPFQVAKSNSPSDIISSSNNKWTSSRLTKIDTTITCGIAGFGLQTIDKNAFINFEMRTVNNKKETFNKIDLFYGKGLSKVIFEFNDTPKEFEIDSTSEYNSFDLETPISNFKVSFTKKDSLPLKFFGTILSKNDSSGILYHAIGANGATFSDYNKTKLFWKQLPKLNADCYIISLGTNEAQDQKLSSEQFLLQIKTSVEKLKLISPNAAIVLVTPPLSYFKQKSPNKVLKMMTETIKKYALENEIAYWDFFNISKGLEGASTWKKMGLLRPDLVHYSKEGYALQGKLLADAFSKLYNDFLLTKK